MRTKGAAGAFFTRPIVTVLVIGLIIRLVLMPVLTYAYDVWHWAVTIENIQAGYGLYGAPGYWYTQVWGYVLNGVSAFLEMLGIHDYSHTFTEALPLDGLFCQTSVLTTPLFSFIVKIPLVISDILVGYLIYRFIIEITGDGKKAAKGFALWFLCPVVLFMSAVQGMFDTISVLFMVLSVYLLYRGHDLSAGASFAVAVLTKMFPVYIVFALIAFIAMKHRGDRRMFRKHLGYAALGAGITALLIYLPQILDGTAMLSLEFLFNRVGGATGGGGIPAVGLWGEISAAGFLIVLLLQPVILGLAAYLAYRMYKKGGGNVNEAFLICLMATTAVTFLWPPSPQYLLVIFPFLIFVIVMFDGRFIVPYLAVSFGALLFAVLFTNFALLLSLAAYTDILDLGQIVSLIEGLNAEFIPGMTGQELLTIVGGITEAVGIALMLLYWIRYEKRMRNASQSIE